MNSKNVEYLKKGVYYFFYNFGNILIIIINNKKNINSHCKNKNNKINNILYFKKMSLLLYVIE